MPVEARNNLSAFANQWGTLPYSFMRGEELVGSINIVTRGYSAQCLLTTDWLSLRLIWLIKNRSQIDSDFVIMLHVLDHGFYPPIVFYVRIV